MKATLQPNAHWIKRTIGVIMKDFLTLTHTHTRSPLICCGVIHDFIDGITISIKSKIKNCFDHKRVINFWLSKRQCAGTGFFSSTWLISISLFVGCYYGSVHLLISNNLTANIWLCMHLAYQQFIFSCSKISLFLILA
jgi:hypothetical protein